MLRRVSERAWPAKRARRRPRGCRGRARALHVVADVQRERADVADTTSRAGSRRNATRAPQISKARRVDSSAARLARWTAIERLAPPPRASRLRPTRAAAAKTALSRREHLRAPSRRSRPGRGRCSREVGTLAHPLAARSRAPPARHRRGSPRTPSVNVRGSSRHPGARARRSRRRARHEKSSIRTPQETVGRMPITSHSSTSVHLGRVARHEHRDRPIRIGLVAGHGHPEQQPVGVTARARRSACVQVSRQPSPSRRQLRGVDARRHAASGAVSLPTEASS